MIYHYVRLKSPLMLKLTDNKEKSDTLGFHLN